MRTQNNATKVVIEGLQVSVEKITPEQRMNRNRLQEELNSQQVKPMSFEIFQKTQEEKNILQKLKSVRKTKWSKAIPFEIFKDAWQRGIIQKN